MGGFLGIVLPIAFLIVAASLKYLGRKSWLRSLAGSFVGFLCYPAAIALLFWALASEKYGELLAWSMMFGLPIIIGLMLLIAAYFVNVAILCFFGGLRAGLVTGFVVLPLMWALCFGSGYNLLHAYEDKRTSLDPLDAVERGDYAYLEQKVGPEDAAYLWKLAIGRLDLKAAEIALAKGADVNAPLQLVGDVSQTPLQAVLEPISQEARNLDANDRQARQKALIAFLLAHKADPNATKRPEAAPLLLAIGKMGDPEVVKELLAAGARLAKDGGALQLACQSNLPESTEIARILLDAGADVNAPGGSEGRSPLQCAALGLPGTISLLVERGANPRPSPLRDPDEAPILIALLGRRPDNALLLLRDGADPLARTSDGLTAWQLTRDPALRAALEQKGVRPEISTGDLVPSVGNTATMLMEAFRRNTSIYPLRDVITAQLRGAGPWNLRVLFPGDSSPVLLNDVTRIEILDLGADAKGSERNVRNRIVIGDKEPAEGQQSRTIEDLEPFSDQVRLGYSVTFTFKDATASSR